jgi:hypothetical protein
VTTAQDVERARRELRTAELERDILRGIRDEYTRRLRLGYVLLLLPVLHVISGVVCVVLDNVTRLNLGAVSAVSLAVGVFGTIAVATYLEYLRGTNVVKRQLSANDTTVELAPDQLLLEAEALFTKRLERWSTLASEAPTRLT